VPIAIVPIQGVIPKLLLGSRFNSAYCTVADKPVGGSKVPE